jgi:hypothetical protein
MNLLAAAFALFAAAPPPPAPGAETAIPFVSRQGILDWQAAGDSSLYVRGYNGRWYLVRTMNLCPRLRDSVTLGFVTSALDQLDRHGAIRVQGETCPVESVVESPAPPDRHKHRR